ncbi:hypothetical protein [uncultured Aquimarina sp.]|uniref:hypothetical protein n=1 Tax=uncultured Aquimarina sp. TaxID=575652 RepID=UPI00260AD516|nr:hypothetical protein [uncultured Aquimarina sp.]
MKKLFIITISIFMLASFNPKKKNRPYQFIIGGADLIVEGNIERITTGQGSILKNRYQLVVTDYLKSNTQRKNITVQMFEEWTCDIRRKRVTEGQKLLLFLKEGGNGYYQIIHGSNGELIIENDSILNYIDQFPSKKYPEFKEAVTMFLESYEYNGPIYTLSSEKVKFKKLKPDTEINSMVSKNDFFKILTENVKRYQ